MKIRTAFSPSGWAVLSVLIIWAVCFPAPGYSQEKPDSTEDKGFSIEFPEILGTGPAAIASPALPLRLSDDVTILECGFGILKPKDPRTLEFLPTSTIPLDQEVNYGWVIKLKTTLPKITWREEFELPRMPLSWDSPDAKISADQRIATFEKESTVDNGYIWNFWKVAFGDPDGTCKIRISLQGTQVKEFVFDCVNP